MKIGFVGAGKMAGSLIRGLLDAGVCGRDDIAAHDRSSEILSSLIARTKVVAALSNAAAVEASDVAILCVKPDDVKLALDECREKLSGKLLISIAAGVNIRRLEELAGGARIIRAMPNTAVQARQGAIAYAGSSQATPEDLAAAGKIFGSAGFAIELPEKDLDAVTGLSGSGPAYACLVIEALSDGGVAAGLPRAIATRLAAQVLLGTAQMVIDSGEHPAALREAVTSPGGTTAAALAVLESHAVRSAFACAVKAATSRSKELGC